VYPEHAAGHIDERRLQLAKIRAHFKEVRSALTALCPLGKDHFYTPGGSLRIADSWQIRQDFQHPQGRERAGIVLAPGSAEFTQLGRSSARPAIFAYQAGEVSCSFVNALILTQPEPDERREQQGGIRQHPGLVILPVAAKNFGDVDRDGKRAFFRLMSKDLLDHRLNTRIVVPETHIRQETKLMI